MKISCMCSYESRETFTEHQVEMMSAAITGAVEEVIVEQCSVIGREMVESEGQGDFDEKKQSQMLH